MSLARPGSGVTVDPLNENGCFGRDGSAIGGGRGMGVVQGRGVMVWLVDLGDVSSEGTCSDGNGGWLSDSSLVRG